MKCFTLPEFVRKADYIIHIEQDSDNGTGRPSELDLVALTMDDARRLRDFLIKAVGFTDPMTEEEKAKSQEAFRRDLRERMHPASGEWTLD
jgi:hypothetical protein